MSKNILDLIQKNIPEIANRYSKRKEWENSPFAWAHEEAERAYKERLRKREIPLPAQEICDWVKEL